MQSQTISAVLGHLKKGTGVDFSQYKESTLRRQLQRRMAIRQVADLDTYVRLLRDDAEEAPALLHNLLVNVTAFFRDPEAFDVLAQLLKDYGAPLAPQAKIRVWVPGCATGKEVYTLAMVISQVLGHPTVLADRLKVFGTDLDEEALAVARRGVFPLSEAQAIPADLRSRFLDEEAEQFTIKDHLRDCVVFARHNVSEDPPFPRLDLISCRNTLIYFTPPLQERVISLFRFGLLPGGLLFLGNPSPWATATRALPWPMPPTASTVAVARWPDAPWHPWALMEAGGPGLGRLWPATWCSAILYRNST